MVEGYETERQRARRLAREREESARASELARREALDALRRALPEAAERLRATSPDCMIEVMGLRFWARTPVVKRRVPGWFIGRVPFRWEQAGAESYGELRLSFAVGVDGRLYLGRAGIGDRREFRTTVPQFRFESLARFTTESLKELSGRLQAVGQPPTEA